MRSRLKKISKIIKNIPEAKFGLVLLFLVVIVMIGFEKSIDLNSPGDIGRKFASSDLLDWHLARDIDSSNNLKFFIYPDIWNKIVKLRIELSTFEEVIYLFMHNEEGKLVLGRELYMNNHLSRNFNIDLNDFNSGSYVFTLKTMHGNKVGKILLVD